MKPLPLNSTNAVAPNSSSRDRRLSDRELTGAFLSSLLEMSAWQSQRSQQIAQQRAESEARLNDEVLKKLKPASSEMPAVETPSITAHLLKSADSQDILIDRFQWLGSQFNEALLQSGSPKMPPVAPTPERKAADREHVRQLHHTMEMGLIRSRTNLPETNVVGENYSPRYLNQAMRSYHQHALMI